MSKNRHLLSTCKLYTLNVVYTVHIVYLHSLDLSAASQQHVFISLDWGYKRFDFFFFKQLCSQHILASSSVLMCTKWFHGNNGHGEMFEIQSKLQSSKSWLFEFEICVTLYQRQLSQTHFYCKVGRALHRGRWYTLPHTSYVLFGFFFPP